MSSRVLAGRKNDSNGKPSLAAGVVSRNKRSEVLANAPDFTPPGKENVALRLAKNITVNDDGRPKSELLVVDNASARSSSDASARSSSDASDTMDAGFLAETSTATFGSDSDDSSPQLPSPKPEAAEKLKVTPQLVENYDAEDDDEDEDDEFLGIARGGKVIYQDHSTMSPQNIDVSMSRTTAFPAVKKFCTDNADLGGGGSLLTTPRSGAIRRTLRTPVNGHDATMDSIVPTDIDESFAVGGVGDMPAIAAPAFRSYAALLSPSSGDELHSDIQPYSGTPSPIKRRSPLREELHRREQLQHRLDSVEEPKDSDGDVQPDDSHVYALPRRTAAGDGTSHASLSTPRRAAASTDEDVHPPGAKKLCTPALKKVQASASASAVVTDSPVAPTVEHTAMIEKIKHLRGVIDRDSSLEKQARQALEHCFARDAAGTQQELEAERLMLLAGMRSSRCTSEVERLRQQVAAPLPSGNRTSTETQSACNVELALSDICIPLHLNFLATVGRDSVAHFVVVARCSCDVVAMTHVQSSREIAGLGGVLKFSDFLSLSPIPVDSQLDIELYYMVLGRKASTDTDITVTPRKRRLLGQHGHLAKLTPKKQKPAGSTLSLSATPAAARMTRFALGASCQLSLSSLQTYSSFKMQEWSSHQLLHGNVDMRVVGCPLYSEHRHSGFLTWREEISGQPNWRRFWCQLDGAVLKAWQYPADEEAEAEPIQTLDLGALVTGDFKISAGAPSSLVCIRKNSVVIDAQSDTEDSKRYLYFADSKANQVVWIGAFQQACLNLQTWRTLPR